MVIHVPTQPSHRSSARVGVLVLGVEVLEVWRGMGCAGEDAGMLMSTQEEPGCVTGS